MMGGEHPGVAWRECGGKGLADELLCTLLSGNEEMSLTWSCTCCSTDSYSLWFSSNPSTSSNFLL